MTDWLGYALGLAALVCMLLPPRFDPAIRFKEWLESGEPLKCGLGWCGGRVVSGTHGGVVWVGWRCERCGKVKHYAPAAGGINEE